MNLMEPTSDLPVFFDEKNETLTPASGIGAIKLGTHASRCLMLLLREQGNYVSNEDILNYCWRKQGFEVSNASVRQVIASLRRSLESLGIDKKSISNAQNKGYCLKDNSVIFLASEKYNLPKSQKKPLPYHAKTPAPHYSSKIIHKVNSFKIIPLVLSLLLSFLFFSYRYSYIFKPVNYHFIYKKDDITVYYQEGYTPSLNIISELKNYQEIGYLAIPPNAYVYINRTWRNENISAFICAGEITMVNAKCSSIIITGGAQ